MILWHNYMLSAIWVGCCQPPRPRVGLVACRAAGGGRAAAAWLDATNLGLPLMLGRLLLGYASWQGWVTAEWHGVGIMNIRSA